MRLGLRDARRLETRLETRLGDRVVDGAGDTAKSRRDIIDKGREVRPGAEDLRNGVFDL